MIQCGRYRPFEDSLVLSAEAFARTSAIAATTAVTPPFRMVEERAATRFRDPTLTRLTRPSFRPFLSSYKNSYRRASKFFTETESPRNALKNVTRGTRTRRWRYTGWSL